MSWRKSFWKRTSSRPPPKGSRSGKSSARSAAVKTIFADALYWSALINPKDQWHGRALEAARALGQARLVTTEGVLTEVLNFYAEGGQS